MINYASRALFNKPLNCNLNVIILFAKVSTLKLVVSLKDCMFLHSTTPVSWLFLLHHHKHVAGNFRKPTLLLTYCIAAVLSASSYRHWTWLLCEWSWPRCCFVAKTIGHHVQQFCHEPCFFTVLMNIGIVLTLGSHGSASCLKDSHVPGTWNDHLGMAEPALWVKTDTSWWLTEVTWVTQVLYVFWTNWTNLHI